MTRAYEDLKKGPYPSNIRELERSRYVTEMYSEALEPERYLTQFGYGGYISIPGLGAGVASRVTKRPDLLRESAYIRLLDPNAGFYTTDALRKICDIADKYAQGILHLHANTGTLEIKGIDMKRIYDMVKDLNSKVGIDVGSTGDDIRNVESCMGATLCEWDLIDAPAMRDAIGRACLEDQQFPRFPSKFKIKISGCPNDATRAVQKADLAFIGVFKDLPIINKGELREWISEAGDISQLCSLCPKGAISWDGEELRIDPDLCIRCFACINNCWAIRPGLERGVAVLIGGKLGNRGRYGLQMAKAIIPFMKTKPPDYREVVDITYKIIDVWDEYGRRKERFGDFILRYGLDRFLEAVGVEPTPQILASPRTTTHIHYR